MRRTRRLTRAQSKYGCMTCKSRKVRCDETHPVCRRCTNSGFVCEGYANIRPASPARDSTGSSQSWIATDPSSSLRATTTLAAPVAIENETQQKLSQILQSSHIAYVGRDALENVIRATSQLAPSSLTALPALEILVQRDSGNGLGDAESRLRVDTLYGQAIRLFVDEILQDSADSNAIFITVIILIAIELLQRRRQDAWKHLLGLRQSLTGSLTTGARSSDIDFLYRIYDLQTMLYSDGVRASMIESQSDFALKNVEVDSLSFQEMEQSVVNILHSAQGLISRLHYAEVLGGLPEERQVEEQIRRADVLLAVEFIDHKLNTGRLPEPSQESVYLILRNLCLKTIMELDQLRSTDEMSWDQYAEEFQSVVEAAETVLSQPRPTFGSSSVPEQLSLTLQIGIIPPLVLTALKYRHPLWRRRASACLRQAGIEGPFIGKQLAAIVERCMEIEESGTRQSSASTPEPSHQIARLDVRMPTEDRRVAYCFTDDDNGNADQSSWPGTARGTTLISLLARKSPASVLSAKVVTSSYFRTGDEYQVLQDRSLDTSVWRAWTETIQFNGPSDQQ